TFIAIQPRKRIMHVALKRPVRASLYALIASVLVAAAAPALAETAYIAQVAGRPATATATQNGLLSNPVSAPQYGPRQAAFTPAPGIAAPVRNGNFAQTIQLGNFNQVGQFQAGQGNFSNVGILGGQ